MKPGCSDIALMLERSRSPQTQTFTSNSTISVDRVDPLHGDGLGMVRSRSATIHRVPQTKALIDAAEVTHWTKHEKRLARDFGGAAMAMKAMPRRSWWPSSVPRFLRRISN
jgi:hypothetical protein